MPTNAELKALTASQITAQTAPGSVTRANIKGRLDAGYDYTDQEVATVATVADDAASDAAAAVSAAAGAVSDAAAASAAASAATDRANHTGTQSADTLVDGSTNKAFTAAERTKLAGVATGATANSSDAYLLSRANHTGTQSADTIVDGTTNKVFTATEKTDLATIKALVGDGVTDGDAIVDTLSEMLTVFQTYSEGVDLATQLANKLNASSASNTLYVSKDGDDGTGTRERVDLPFLTINAAVLAATSGDTIVIYPGNYTVTSKLPIETGINYHFIGKGTVTLGAGASGDYIFRNATSTTASSIVFAPGWNFTVTDASDGIYYQVAAGESTFIFNEVNHIVTGSAPCIRLDGTGILNFRGNKLTHMGSGVCLYIQGSGSNNPTMRGDITHIENNDENCLYIDFGSMLLNYKKMLRTNTTNTNYLININTASVNEVYLRGQTTYCGNGWVIFTDGASKKVFMDCDYIEGGGTCTVVGSAPTGMTTVRAGTIANHRATGTYGILHAEGGPLTVIGARVERIGAASGFDVKTSGSSVLLLLGVSYNRSLISSAAVGSIVDESVSITDNHFFAGLGTEADPFTMRTALNGTAAATEVMTIDLTDIPSTAKRLQVWFEIYADAAYDWRFQIERNTVGAVDSGGSDYNTTTDDTGQADLSYGKMQADVSRIAGCITIINPKASARLLVKTETWGVTSAGKASESLFTNTYLTNSGALKKIKILSSGTGTGGSVDITTAEYFVEYSKNGA